MQSDRARELERVYQSRRGHAAQLSISDDNHHVTEAIGDMYGDTPTPEFSLRNNRPLSFVPSPLGESLETNSSYFQRTQGEPGRPPLGRVGSNERVPPQVNGINGNSKRMAVDGMDGMRQDSPVSPQMLNRNTSDTASQHFPMNLDYSKPEDVAQELSNLQAIRRMSMDVNSQDPDLPSFNPGFRVPALAPPTHGADEGDPSRLFWVPARLHPELAPKEFKTFIEDKVKTIKRTSAGEESLLSTDGLQRQPSAGGSLRRKKSMLSRQIDSGANYEDGAERLERKKSLSSRAGAGAVPESPAVGLKELESLVNDPAKLARRLSSEAHRESLDSGIDLPTEGDAPILPAKPAGGPTLKRSTRTQYRRGSTRKGEKLPFSKRIAQRQGQTESEGEESPASPNNDIPEVPSLHLSRIQTEPIPPLPSSVENFSRPGRKQPRSPPSTVPGYFGEAGSAPREEGGPTEREQQISPPPGPGRRVFHSRIASNGRTTAASIGAVPVPQIVETPPQPDPSYPQAGPVQHPERKSSRSPTSPEPPPSLPPQQPLPNRPRPMPQAPRPNIARQAPLPQPPRQSLDDMAAHPSPLPGSGTRTDTLAFIPTMAEDKKPVEKDKRKGKEDSRKTSWSWGSLLGSDEKEKEKERERREREEAAKKATKSRLGRSGESSDSTRLDVLQQSIDGRQPRESLVLDRNSLRLEEERKKESNRKSGGDSKKEKDSSIFSSLFGGSKKKAEKESSGKKGSSSRGLSPEPPPRILKPDVDYNWTRFSIMEERAIYRMAHIKLANPKRELYSQVLLSNFMYSYLAKVQSQHPQLQVPAAMQQKRQQGPPGQKKEGQPEEFAQYQRYQEPDFLLKQQQARSESQNQQQEPSGSQNNKPSTDPPAGHEDEDGPAVGNNNVRPDSRVSQHTQYAPQQQYQHQHQHQHQNQNQHQNQHQHQHQHQQPQQSQYGGGGAGPPNGAHGGAPIAHGQQNYLGHMAAHRSQPLIQDAGQREEHMWT
ncbi:hypothetical protein NA57DRAFT_57431 [Rhizodiscina lignyota]|uniref:Protein Zds1 C-terminal domain-containing protein n=1 Tax=Rhizodiscina lignyota TaxID=1504668 RepID=A0A9P4IEN8_9PEZI|nr:hypothetical protein NA57DRAFT_57431 [Rhizodiscina lignyota]